MRTGKTMKIICLIITLLTSSSVLSINTYERPPVIKQLISFGDSLSDVGTYEVGAIASMGGGRYTINALNSDIWLEILAKELCLADPCAAITGLDGTAFSQVPVANNITCQNYAEGGARVTNALGFGNAASPDSLASLGALTVPVLSQINQYLSFASGFTPTDLVTLWVGLDDIFANIPDNAALKNLSEAAKELASYIKNMLIKNGARRILVLNIPDIRYSPYGQQLNPAKRSRLNQFIMVFNNTLAEELTIVPNEVLLLDMYTQMHFWFNDPAFYGITNMTSPACNLAALLLPTALLCTSSTLISSNDAGYFFADLINPSPHGSKLIADFVIKNLKTRGWIPRR